MRIIKTVPAILLSAAAAVAAETTTYPAYDAASLMQRYELSKDQAHSYSSTFDNLLHIDHHHQTLPQVNQLGPSFCRILMDQAKATPVDKSIRLYALAKSLGQCTDSESLEMITNYLADSPGYYEFDRELIGELYGSPLPAVRAAVDKLVSIQINRHYQNVENQQESRKLTSFLWSIAHLESESLLPSLATFASKILAGEYSISEGRIEPLLVSLGSARDKLSLDLLVKFSKSPLTRVRFAGIIADSLLNREQSGAARELIDNFHTQCQGDDSPAGCYDQLAWIEMVEGQLDELAALPVEENSVVITPVGENSTEESPVKVQAKKDVQQDITQ